MNVISKFCNRTLYLKNGTQVMFDKTDKVVRQYLKDQKSKTRNLSET
jgi:ABC-type polysaccharide/polyol phosphate transport system ATPase subunit